MLTLHELPIQLLSSESCPRRVGTHCLPPSQATTAVAHQLYPHHHPHPHPLAQTLHSPMLSEPPAQHLVAVSPLCLKALCPTATTAASLAMQTVSLSTSVASLGIRLRQAGIIPPLRLLLGKRELQVSLLDAAGVQLCLQTTRLPLQR